MNLLCFFTVLGSDTASEGRPSDTEDLVRDDTLSTEEHNGAHVNIALASSQSSVHSQLQNEVKFQVQIYRALVNFYLVTF